MKHPSEYTTTPLLGMHFVRVDAGTVITDQRTGKQATINDDNYLIRGNVVFCTHKTFDDVKANLQ